VAVVVVTDSSTCIPPDLLDSLPVRVVPIIVHLPDGDRKDGSPEVLAEVYAALEANVTVKSTSPSALDYLSAIDAAAEGGNEVVLVTPAKEFTSMHQRASQAAEHSKASVAVVDSRTAASGQGLVVLEVAEAAAHGAELTHCLAVAEEAVAAVDLVATVEAVGLLRRSGRIPDELTAGAVSQTVFRMKQGIIEPLSREPSLEAALARLEETWKLAGGPALRRAAVFHAGRPEAARRLQRSLENVEFVSGFSAAMAIHTGPGVVGAAWLA